MIQAEERNDITPICPHCNQPLTQLYYKEIGTVLGRRFIYFCAQCSKVLGVSHRKGFWMG